MTIDYNRIPDADYDDIKLAIQYLRNIDDKRDESFPAHVVTLEVRSMAIESIFTIIVNYFPEKVRLIVAITIDLLQKIAEAKYTDSGEEKKINWFKRNKLGAATLIAVIKIVAIIFRKSK